MRTLCLAIWETGEWHKGLLLFNVIRCCNICDVLTSRFSHSQFFRLQTDFQSVYRKSYSTETALTFGTITCRRRQHGVRVEVRQLASTPSTTRLATTTEYFLRNFVDGAGLVHIMNDRWQHASVRIRSHYQRHLARRSLAEPHKTQFAASSYLFPIHC